MSFWRSATGPTWWQAAQAFWSVRPPERLEGKDAIQVPFMPEPANQSHSASILDFWRQHFKSGTGPRIGYTQQQLENIIADPNYDILIVLIEGRIVGTVMARSLGYWTRAPALHGNFSTSWIDMYCVAADWRHRGVGRSLLFGVYDVLRRKGRESAVFLKEGAPLLMPSICSSFYSWRRVRPEEVARSVDQWTRADFDDWARTAQLKNTIYNSGVSESLIIAYAAQNAWLVAAFTPAHQLHPEDNQPLIWMTGCAADGPIAPNEKKEAMLQLSTAAARHFNTHWIWVDGFHAPPDERWLRDGLYHIYAFNWNPGVFFNGNPFIVF